MKTIARTMIEALLLVLLVSAIAWSQAQSAGSPPLRTPPSPGTPQSPDGPSNTTTLDSTKTCDVPDWIAHLDDQVRQGIKDHLSGDDASTFVANDRLACQRDRVRYHLNVLGQMLSARN
jgi:hypothetical protein